MDAIFNFFQPSCRRLNLDEFYTWQNHYQLFTSAFSLYSYKISKFGNRKYMWKVIFRTPSFILKTNRISKFDYYFQSILYTYLNLDNNELNYRRIIQKHDRFHHDRIFYSYWCFLGKFAFPPCYKALFPFHDSFDVDRVPWNISH